jgi:pimeloyl-ACP methyl ester carboxylesterase
VHSQGGNFGFTAALNAPDKIKALIAVEPSGAPDPAKVEVARVKTVPHLIVWGDFLDKNPTTWPGLVPVVRRYRDALLAAGAKADVLDLPASGIKGNTHMLMMDANSDAIAKLIDDWLGKQGLVN